MNTPSQPKHNQPNEPENQSFQVDLKGVVAILSDHLYSGPRVYIRELLQNAVDAITARKSAQPDLVGQITLTVDEATAITIEDNGMGLTPEQAAQFLSTVGSSTKRDDLGFGREDYLGQFGIGLLSSFMVADAVNVTTRSYEQPDMVANWVGRNDGTFTLSHQKADQQDHSIGTRVTLSAKRDAETWFAMDRVVELATHYGELLDVDITVRPNPESKQATTDQTETEINAQQVPWKMFEGDEPTPQLLALGEQLTNASIMDAFPLQLPALDLDGVAFVHTHPMSPTSNPQHRVYLKKMLLTTNADRLLPSWTFFISAVVNSSLLRPTASREQLHDDEVLAGCRDALGVATQEWLYTQASTKPERLEALVDNHHVAMKALCLHDKKFLQQFLNWLPFETTEGRVSLGEFQLLHPVIRYASTVESYREVSPLAQAEGYGLINAGYIYEASLLEAANRTVDGFVAQPLNTEELLDQLEQVNDSADTQKSAIKQLQLIAEQTLAPFDCGCEIRRFNPAELPALHLSGDGGSAGTVLRQTSNLEDNLFEGLLDPIVNGLPKKWICLNANNQVIQRLLTCVNDQTSTEVAADAIRLIYVQAMVAGRQPVTENILATMGGAITRLIDRAAQ